MNAIDRRKVLKTVATGLGATLIQPIAGVLAQTPSSRTLTIGINALTAALDPHHQAGSIVGNRVYNLMYDQLTQVDLQGRVVPMLATNWQQEGRVWRFLLRSGVRFHDGSEMTARDAAFSLNRLVFGDRPSAIRATFTAFIEKVEARGRNELLITTKQVDPLLPLRLATPFAAIMPEVGVTRAGFEKLQTAPIGAGPYRVTEFVEGNRVVLERFERYWGGSPEAARVVLRLIPENATRIAALQAGEVDLITTIPPDLVDQVERSPRFQIESGQLNNYMLIYFNTKKGPTANVHLRRALSLAIDRKGLAQGLWGGRVRVMNDYFLPGEIAYDAGRPEFAFNLAEARQALRQANYNGEVIEFTPPSTYYTNGRVVSDAINEMWKQLGVNVKYTPLELAQWAERSLGGNNIATLQSFGTQGDPATTTVTQEYTSTAWISQYYSGDDEYRRLAAEAAASTNRTLRIANYKRIKAILDRDVPIAPLYQTVEFYGMRQGIVWKPHQNFYIDLRPGRFSFGKA